MDDERDETSAPELNTDEQALLDEMPTLTNVGQSRRTFLGQTIAGSLGVFALDLLAHEEALAALSPSAGAVFAADTAAEHLIKVALNVNGTANTLDIDARVVLLDALRERLALTGTKKGCDQGTCGACTVIIDGQRVLACLTLAATCAGQDVRTIEELAGDGSLTPLQEAFLECDAYQCGFCTPGQIMSATALLDEVRAGVPSHVTRDVRQRVAAESLSVEEIRERMSGNLCRCGAYPNIVAAVQSVLAAENRR
jgi:xanthine dehydrogenase YagT iron-sulfur-binding subunit